MIIACATNDGKSFVTSHFGDKENPSYLTINKERTVNYTVIQ